MTSACVICHHRLPDYPQVCTGCRTRLAADLTDLVAAHASLSAEPGCSATERITGTRERPLGVRVAVLDLMLPARHTTGVRDVYGDQGGLTPVAVLLESWARDWAGILGHMLPAPTVAILGRWMGLRLEWACDVHPAIDEYTTEVRSALAACRAAMGDRASRPELCEGVACPKCDLRALYRMPNSDLIHCGACPHLLTQEEYDREVQRQAKRATQVACRPTKIVSH